MTGHHDPLDHHAGMGDDPAPATLLGIHVTCAGGTEHDDPSVTLLTDLLRSRRPDAPYVVLDRMDANGGGPFAQAFARDDGTWLVEHRDSQADPLWRAETPDVDAVLAALVGWSLQAPGWSDRLTWAAHDLASELATRAAAAEAGSGRAVLRDSRDEGGTRHLWARLGDDGSIEIEGHDLGPGVEKVLGAGNTEYEWRWAVRPGDIPAAVAALGGEFGDDALGVLARWSAANSGADPGRRIRDAGVPVAFDNRVGD